jgi:hypothetical protein
MSGHLWTCRAIRLVQGWPPARFKVFVLGEFLEKLSKLNPSFDRFWITVDGREEGESLLVWVWKVLETIFARPSVTMDTPLDTRLLVTLDTPLMAMWKNVPKRRSWSIDDIWAVKKNRKVLKKTKKNVFAVVSRVLRPISTPPPLPQFS